ncbi:MAG: hypothetical protein AMJ84_10185 [Acidithiobacillales bacterium SM23_46]|nr:MAG: hypothetical protein AMJ84_10185 [Acidithiobacillales bacterium SM23_46]
MDVFLTGASGFVGNAILQRLLELHWRVRCLVRPASRARLEKGFETARGALTPVVGDCLDASCLHRAIRGCRAVIHLVGIIREFPGRGVTFDRLHVEATGNIVHAAREAGVERFVHMSALGARSDAPSRYHRTKYQAEHLVRQSGLNHVIFRPSIIFGPGDEFVNLLARTVHRLLPAPVIGDGRARLQPVAVENVADGFARALTTPDCLNRLYEVGGPRAYSLVEILDAIARAKGLRRVRKVHLPLSWLRLVVPWLERWRFFPLTTEQLLMLQEDNVCDPRDFVQTFGIEPVEFETAIARYIGQRRPDRQRRD